MPETALHPPSLHRTLVSLRPRGQHAAVRAAAKASNAHCIALSSIKLVALNNDAALAKALHCDILIFTSPAAVRFAASSSVFSIKEKTLCFAPGPGTAAALKKAGVGSIHIPDNGHDSNALLALPNLQKLSGKSVGLITAPGGRGMLEPILRERGAELHIAYVYERKAVRLSNKQKACLRKISAPFAVLCSSHEVFQALWQALDADLQNKLRQGFWVVSSTRLQSLLAEAGISNSTVSPSPEPKAMLEHLQYAPLP
jgi:uroporphyrinogen-III synthase